MYVNSFIDMDYREKDGKVRQFTPFEWVNGLFPSEINSKDGNMQ